MTPHVQILIAFTVLNLICKQLIETTLLWSDLSVTTITLPFFYLSMDFKIAAPCENAEYVLLK